MLLAIVAIYVFVTSFLNTGEVIIPFLYLLKKSENQGFKSEKTSENALGYRPASHSYSQKSLKIYRKIL